MLLDGGPSRAFSDSDIVLMEDDLAMLKVLIIFYLKSDLNLKTSLCILLFLYLSLKIMFFMLGMKPLYDIRCQKARDLQHVYMLFQQT